jgi:hypothetical protein
MRIADIVTMATAGFGDTAARIRRAAIVYGICGACGLIAVVMGISAALLALDPLVGAVYSRLIVAGVFVMVALIAWATVRLSQPRPAAAAAAPLGVAPGAKPQFAQIAMIVEAVMLGYSLSKRRR